MPAPIMYFLVPRRLRTVVLQYHSGDEESLSQTFRVGLSYAEVLRQRGKAVFLREELGEDDISQIGFAVVFPWPVPDTTEIRRRLAQNQGAS